MSRRYLLSKKKFKMGLLKYLWTADIKSYLSAPFIYSLIIPLLALDIFISSYQFICFPLYGIEKVRRSNYIIFDRAHLAYLNVFEKINCAYCSYANGLIGFCRDISGKKKKNLNLGDVIAWVSGSCLEIPARCSPRGRQLQ